MMLTKHIFDYLPIQEKKQIGGVEDMEFQRVLRKASRSSIINLKSGFSRSDEEKDFWSWNFKGI